eukprot:TRINITY_DN13912_c0_g1_i1.p1 TRINITY_DN13912_c0_g1~~TRINITY_DN13912_c0_g1_i1.p1  ORF type:complete len:349 (-),score=33.82 TRINITY_DN13912_c0_g1_i1:184-1230(-)
MSRRRSQQDSRDSSSRSPPPSTRNFSEDPPEVRRILEARTLFDVLEVPRESFAPESKSFSFDAFALSVKKRYHAVSVKVHPDRCHTPNAKDAFQVINAARDTLMDPDRCLRYATDLDRGEGDLQAGYAYHRTNDMPEMPAFIKKFVDKHPRLAAVIFVVFIIVMVACRVALFICRTPLHAAVAFHLPSFLVSLISRGSVGFWKGWLLAFPALHAASQFALHHAQKYLSRGPRRMAVLSVVNLFCGLTPLSAGVTSAIVMTRAEYGTILSYVWSVGTAIVAHFVMQALANEEAEAEGAPGEGEDEKKSEEATAQSAKGDSSSPTAAKAGAGKTDASEAGSAEGSAGGAR